MKKFLVFLIMVCLLMLPVTMATAEVNSLEMAGQEMREAVRENPINLAEYMSAQIDFWGELLIKFAQTAKPNVVFGEEVCGGLQLTLYDQESWSLVAGKVFKYPDLELLHQPGFVGVEWKGFPLLKDLAEIFEKLNPEIIWMEKSIKFGITYKFKE